MQRASIPLAVLLYLIPFVTLSQSSSFSLTQRFEIEKNYLFEVTREIDSAISLSTEVTCNVLSIQENGHRTLSLVYGASYSKEINFSKKQRRKLSKLFYEGIELLISVDSFGIFYGIINYESVKARIEDHLIFGSQANGYDLEAEEILEHMGSTYNTPAKLMANYFKEIALYFDVFGTNYTLGRPNLAKNFYQNPYGGRPYPVTTSTTLDSIHNDKAFLQRNVNIDRNDFIEAISEKGFDQTEVDKWLLDVEVRAHFVYDLISRKLLLASQSGTLNSADSESRSGITIELKNQ